METLPSEQVGTKLLFENEQVRVWELAVAPGESLDAHLHQLDYVYIVPSGGILRFTDSKDPNSFHDTTFQDGQVSFVSVSEEGRVDGHLTNVGDKPHLNYIIELKKPKG